MVTAKANVGAAGMVAVVEIERHGSCDGMGLGSLIGVRVYGDNRREQHPFPSSNRRYGQQTKMNAARKEDGGVVVWVVVGSGWESKHATNLTMAV